MKKYIILLLSIIFMLHFHVFAQNTSDNDKSAKYDPVALYKMAMESASDADKMKYINQVLSASPRHFLADDLLFAKYILLIRKYPPEEYLSESGEFYTEYPSPESIGEIFAILDDLAKNYNGYYFNDIGYGLMVDEKELKDNGNGYLFYISPQVLWEEAKIYSSRLKQYKESVDVLNKLEAKYADNRIFDEDVGAGVGIVEPEVNMLKGEIYARKMKDQDAAMKCYLVILSKYSTDYRYSVKGSWKYIGVIEKVDSLLDIKHKKALYEAAVKEIKDPAPRRAVYMELIKLQEDKEQKIALLEKAIKDIFIGKNKAYGDFDNEYNGDAFINELGTLMKDQKEYLSKLDTFEKSARSDKAKGFIAYARANIYSNTGRLSEAKKIYRLLSEDTRYKDVTFDDEEAYYTPNKLGELVKVRLAYVEYLNSNYDAAEKLLTSYSGPSLDSSLIRKKIVALRALMEKKAKTIK